MSEKWKMMLLGRDDELRQLEDLWLKSKAGEPQFVVILGESGLGKTRLIQGFYQILATRYDQPTGSEPKTSTDSCAASIQGYVRVLGRGVRRIVANCLT